MWLTEIDLALADASTFAAIDRQLQEIISRATHLRDEITKANLQSKDDSKSERD